MPAVTMHESQRGRLALAPLAGLCAASGMAALIYQIVWFQLLSLVIGASSVSLGVLLGVFMGGMCLGSLAIGRFIPRNINPLLIFSGIELGIGLCGLLVLAAMPAVAGLYGAVAGPGASGATGLALRAAIASICLLPPTILMGATLPAISRWLEATRNGTAQMGLCYGANIFGAVTGSLLAGFVLLRQHDVAVATYVAVTINLGAAACAWFAAGALRRGTAFQAVHEAICGVEGASVASAGADSSEVVANTEVAGTAGGSENQTGKEDAPTGIRATHEIELSNTVWPVYLVTAVSGFTALSAEVIWTRLLSLLLGATVYTFALVLAVFLFGLGIGSGAGSLVSKRVNPRVALGVCQLLLTGAIAWTSYAVTQFLPYLPLDVTLASSPAVAFQLDLMRVLWAILPGTLLWGASFPLALAALASRERDPGLLMGGLYAANTVGAILGALGTSFVLIVWIGSQQAQQLLIGMSVVAAVIMLAGPADRRSACPRSVRPAGAARPAPPTRPALVAQPARFAVAGAAVLIAIGSLLAVPQIPGSFVAYGRFMPTRALDSDVIYMREGLTSTIAVSRQIDGTLTYHNAGKAQASTYAQDMRLQRMLGHLTTLVPTDGSNYLVIGLGAGVTAGAVSIDPNAERVVIADIEPLTREAAGEFFRPQNFGVVDAPNVELRIDDGRHFLLTTDETFDGITSDPLDPWVKGAAALYTREFWQLVRSRLNDGGVVTVFVQLYEMTEDAVRSELATFFEVFPNGAVFANTVRGQGYDAVLLARADETPIDIDRIDALLRRPDYSRVAASLEEVGFRTATDLLGTYAGGADNLAEWLEGAEINTDRNMRLQYLAGQGLNLYEANVILNNMLSAGQIEADDYFTGSAALMRELRQIVNARQGRF